ncbi:MAG: metal ABC transporter permease [Planctomycetota bacterium]|nr:metal ABC transporter permease [Planctomycetota bacterium]
MIDLLSAEGWEILSVAACASVACGIIGPQLILRRRAMLGDAISHGVLPGLVLGFVISGSRGLFPMMVGALIAALLVSFLAEWLRDRAGLDGGAALGVVFTSLFAIGIILVEIFARDVDLDPGCVLHGMVELAPLDQVVWFGRSIPRSLVPVVIALILNLFVTLLLWKEWKICAFDPTLARSTGLPVKTLEQGLLALVAITSVACFEAVGSVLVIAMLAVPATIAHLLCNRMGSMVIVSMLAGFLSAFIGTISAEQLNTNVPGMMATSSGFLLMGAVLLAPGRGVIPSSVRKLRWNLRVTMEDLLAEAQLCADSSRSVPTARLFSFRHLVTSLLEIRGFIRGGKPRGDGKRIARALLEKRGLWRRFAAERLGLAPDHLDDPAHRIEHHLDEDLTRKIETGLDSKRS